MNAFIGMIVAGQVIRQQIEEDEEEQERYERERARKEQERRAKMTPEQRAAEDEFERQSKTRMYRNTEGAKTKQDIILNKYLSGYATILPTGQIDTRLADSMKVAHHNGISEKDRVSKADVDQLIAEKKRSLQITKLSTAEKLTAWAKKWEEKTSRNFGLFALSGVTLGLPKWTAMAVSACAEKYIASRPENKGKSKLALQTERNKKFEAQKETQKTEDHIKKLEALKKHLVETMTPIDFNKNKPPKVSFYFEQYLAGKCRILPSGKIEDDAYWSRGNHTVSVQDAQSALASTKKGLEMIKPANFAERIVMFGEKLSDHFLTEVAATLTVLPKVVPAITTDILKAQMGTNENKTGLSQPGQTFEDRMSDLKNRKILKKSAEKLPDLIKVLSQKTGR